MLLPRSDLTAEISAKSVMSRLSLLILHFPQMRLLWSRDPYVTAKLFIALKQKQQQPTIEQAVAANSHNLRANQVGYEFSKCINHVKCHCIWNEYSCSVLPFVILSVDMAAASGLTEEEKEEKNLSLTPHDILRKLPGVTPNNIRSLLQNVNNLRELSEASLEQLTKWMGGGKLAMKLYTFLHGQRVRTHQISECCRVDTNCEISLCPCTEEA